MAISVANIEEQLREITDCPICTNTFNDPRILPCIHTFCFDCLKRTAEAAKNEHAGDSMPCPMCRKEFVIPEAGINDVPKNFFMENLLDFKTRLQVGNAIAICDLCNIKNAGKTEQIPAATIRCSECKHNYCDSCIKVHQFLEATRDHQIVPIGSDTLSTITPIHSTKYCTEHPHTPLRLYCAECKKVVCYSCFAESHGSQSHNCIDVDKVEKEFRQAIEKNLLKISNYLDETLSMKNNRRKRETAFLKEIVDKENKIRSVSETLKDKIDACTKSLLDKLLEIKSNHLKEIKIEMEEIDMNCTILKGFEAYCTELISKGSASDICSSVDQLIVRVDELERNHVTFVCRPRKTFEVSFEISDLSCAVMQISSDKAVGKIKEITKQFESNAILVGLNDGTTITKDVIKINLHSPFEIAAQQQIIARMKKEATAVAHSDTLYITGLGNNYYDILKYNQVSGWKRCAYLTQNRRSHSAAFVGKVLYICGGFAVSSQRVISSVEAYDTEINKCGVVGKLVHCVHSSGNCVPLGSSLYIFGGVDEDGQVVSHVQIYDTKHNACTVMSTPMPRPSRLMRAALWETSVILLGRETCFIFDLEAESWQERAQFKTGVVHFGFVLENERIFVIGGGTDEKDKDGKIVWTCKDDVGYIPLQNILEDKHIDWMLCGKLPKPSLVQACANMRYLI